MAKLRLTLAAWRYDRTEPLLDGSVQPDGIELVYVNLPVEETFFRMLRYKEFDVAEMSLSSYVLSLFTADRPFVGIPVFLSRMFRHSSIYVHAGSGIREPRDLIGKKVGTPEYQVTAGVWIRGILADEYGVPPDKVTYYTGGIEQPGRPEKLHLQLPPNLRVYSIPAHRTLSDMIDQGEIDALYSPRMPSSFVAGTGRVVRLFPDFVQEEKAYFRKTGIFPIMHLVVVRRDVYEQYPWVAQSLYKAFATAKQIAYAAMYEAAALRYCLPWLLAQVEEVRGLMGEDFWPYGLEANRKTLATFLRYSYEQGLAQRLLDPGELFAPETLESFKI